MGLSSFHASGKDLNTLQGAAAEDVFVFPVSFAQQRLWFLDRLAPNNPLHNIFVAVHLKGRLNVASLQQTLNEIVRRHEILRTTFALMDGQPMQVVVAAQALPLRRIDLCTMPAGQRQALTQHLATQEMRRPFDLATGPLLRATLLLLDEAEHVVLLTMHHIISDGWSIEVFIREITALYAAFVRGAPSPLPELRIQYADFAHWQRQWLQGEVLETSLAYWKQQLAGAPLLLALPTDRARPALSTSRGGRQACCFPGVLSEELKALSRRQGVTLFMVLLASFKILLRYVTGCDDLVVGTDVSNRNHAETEGLIGFFVNQLVLRSDLSGNPTFRELLARIRRMTLAAYDHQNLPFERLVAALKPERSLQYAPVFQVKLVLQNPPMGSLELPDLHLKALEVERQTAGFDVLLYLWEAPTGLRGWFEYSADLFDAGTIARLEEHFMTVLRQVVTQPDTRLNVLDTILADADRQQRCRQQRERQALNLHALKQVRRQTMRVSPLKSEERP
jgi:non-ribosomal peptide synthetase component F